MQRTAILLPAQIVGFGLLLAALGFAFPALAYDGLEVDLDLRDDTVEVEVTYEADGDPVANSYEYETVDLADVIEALADELGVSEGTIEAALDADSEHALSAFEAIADAADEVAEAEAYFDELGADSQDEVENDLDAARESLDDAEDAYEDEEFKAAADFAAEAEEAAEAVLAHAEAAENEDEADAVDAIEDAEEAIEAAEEFVEAFAGDDKGRIEGWLNTALRYLDNAEDAYEDEEYEAAEEWAEKAEDKAELILDYESEDKGEDKDDEEKVYVCHQTGAAGSKTLAIAPAALDAHLGHGDTKGACDGDDDKDAEKDDDKAEKAETKDYGKTDDRVELQKQLQELLTLLIQLLQQQAQMQN